ncbi:hypothetical protein PsorP6_004720 [Peronosclerospora sorghi]|uniref:Uncharacterized protein n=1 Tax=Peronosclerospora sorghi TaxID=230839 RepID=A0ACC0VMG7_9STRA|nr:hypothetical protein PsorP6_004720 [Peronosclerospora sorghi]
MPPVDSAVEEDPVAEEDPAVAEPEEEVAASLNAYFSGKLFSRPETAYDALTAECIRRGFVCTVEKRTNKDIEPGQLRERIRKPYVIKCNINCGNAVSSTKRSKAE